MCSFSWKMGINGLTYVHHMPELGLTLETDSCYLLVLVGMKIPSLNRSTRILCKNHVK